MLLQNRSRSEMQLSTLSNKMTFQSRSKNYRLLRQDTILRGRQEITRNTSGCQQKNHCWEQDALAKTGMNRICGQKAVGVYSDKGWNLIWASLKKKKNLSGWKVQGKASQWCWSCHQSVCGAITAHKKKLTWNCRCNRNSDCCITYEVKKDHLRHPFQKDGPLHAVHWLEIRIGEVQEAILKKGDKIFRIEFPFFFMTMLLL